MSSQRSAVQTGGAAASDRAPIAVTIPAGGPFLVTVIVRLSYYGFMWMRWRPLVSPRARKRRARREESSGDRS
jgi:hypothetical protein